MPYSQVLSSLHAARAIFDAIPAPVFVKDRQHRLVLVNDAFCRMAGVPAEALMGRSDADFFPPDQVELYWAIDDRVFETGETIENEEPVTFADTGVRTCVTRKHRAHLFDGAGDPQPFVVAVINDVTVVREAEARARHAERVQTTEAEILARMNQGAALPELLGMIASAMDELSPDATSSILLHDQDRGILTPGAAPGLPQDYVEAMSAVPVGPKCGSCGTAVYRRTGVTVIDIAADPLWDGFRDVALPHGLRACASTPILDDSGGVLGAFALYYREAGGVREEDLELARRMTDLAALAIERERREEALRATQDRFERLADAVGAAVWIASPDGQEIPYMSAGYERLWGRSLAGLREDPQVWMKAIHEDDRSRLAAIVANSEPAYDTEFRIVRPDGEIRCVRAIGTPVHDASGAVAWVAGIAYDITDLKQAEQAARASEERFEQLAQNIDDMFWITDADTGEFVYVSPGYERSWGWPAEALYEDKAFWLNGVAEEDREKVAEALAGGMAGFQVEYRARQADGRQRWVSTRGFPVRDASGKVYRIAGLSTDVTRLKEAEWVALASSERAQAEAAWRNAIFDSARDAIVTLDADGCIESVNKAGEHMFCYEREELLGKDAAVLLNDQPHDARPLVKRLQDALTDDRKVYELEVVRKGGGLVHVDVNVGVLDQCGRVHYVAVLRDSTERKRIERSKDEFISTVSHELRTPLTSIAGSLGLLVGGAGGELPERASRLITIAESNSRRLVRLINDILDIEKMQSGAMKFAFAPVDLAELSVRAIESMAGLAAQQKVRFEPTVPGEAVTVRGDSDRLTQVLTNLLSNAAKFSPEGGHVDVTVSAAGPRARLSVRDRGAGIPLEFQDRIFGKFAQADASDTRQKGGTGLGLAICKEIVERHGGRIWFESTVGEGATFHVELPVAFDAQLATSASMPRPSGRLLLCEDDPDISAFLCQALATSGFDVEIAPTIADAEAALARPDAFGALLLDLRLPDGNGLDLLGRLRARADTHGLPVIVISADAQEKVAAGVDVVDWVQKPVDLNRLRAALDQAVRPKAEPPLVLYVDDDADLRGLVCEAFGDKARILTSDSLESARRLLREVTPEVAILDMGLPDGCGLELLPDLFHEDGEAVPVVIFSAQSLNQFGLTEVVDAVLTKSRTTLDQLTRTVNRLRDDYPRHGQGTST